MAKYTVTVTSLASDSAEPQFEEFENQDTRNADELKSLREEAQAAFVAAVKEFDFTHKVSLVQEFGPDEKGTGSVALSEATGTGSGSLSDNNDDDAPRHAFEEA